MTEQQSAPIALGTYVKVSDGQPRPPERFTRKLKDWKYDNYEGVVVQASEGLTYTVQAPTDRGWAASGYIVLLRSGVPARKVTPVPGIGLVALNGKGISATVDINSVIRRLAEASSAAAAA